jgi:hypothetical protein
MKDRRVKRTLFGVGNNESRVSIGEKVNEDEYDSCILYENRRMKPVEIITMGEGDEGK